MHDYAGQRVSRYEIQTLLGRGGMGEVYRAIDTRLGSTVAVKFIRIDAVEGGAGPEAVARFQREAQVLASLSHPHIVKIIDYGVQDGNPYLVTDFVPGGTLADRTGTALSWRDAARLLAPIARALDYAHARGVAHRDLKPANILLSEDGQPVLADFGIAKVFATESGAAPTALSVAGVGIGTPAYMSPEQAQGRALDGRSDVYSLGIIAYELTTAHRPFGGQDVWAIMEQQISARPLSPRRLVPGLPRDAEQLILAALAKDPGQRPTMTWMANTLERVATPRAARATWVAGALRWTGGCLLALLGLAVVASLAWSWLLSNVRGWVLGALPNVPVLVATLQSQPGATPPTTAAAPTAIPTPDLPDVFGEVRNAGWQSPMGEVVIARRDTDGATRMATIPESGQYRIDDLEPGSWTIDVRGRQLYVTAVHLLVEIGMSYRLDLNTYDRLALTDVVVGDGGIVEASWNAIGRADDSALIVRYRCEYWLNGELLEATNDIDETTCRATPNASASRVFRGDAFEVRVLAFVGQTETSTGQLRAVGSETVLWP